MALSDLIRRTPETQRPLATRPEWEPIRRMRELIGYDPFSEMMRMWPAEERMLPVMPAFELRETPDSYIFKADVPGIRDEDLEVTLTGNRLTVTGKREMESREENDRYFMMERSYGSFTRSFTLPEGTDTDNIKSELKDGVLTLALPKRPEVQPKKITVKASSGKAPKA